MRVPERAVSESKHDEEGFCSGWKPAAGLQNTRGVENIHEEGQPSAGSQSPSGVKKVSTQSAWVCGVRTQAGKEGLLCT